MCQLTGGPNERSSCTNQSGRPLKLPALLRPYSTRQYYLWNQDVVKGGVIFSLQIFGLAVDRSAI